MKDSFVHKSPQGGYLPFLLVFALLALLGIFITMPIIRPLMWAVIFSFISYPLNEILHKKVFRGKHRNLSSLVSTTCVVLLLCVPMGFIGISLAKEAIKFISSLSDNLESIQQVLISAWSGLVKKLPDHLIRYAGIKEDPAFLQDLTHRAVSYLASSLGDFSRGLLGNAFKMCYQLFVISVSTFYLLRDGHVVLEFLNDVLPLPKEERAALFDSATRMMKSVVIGTTLTAGIQACLGVAGWVFVGLPAPILAGVFLFICAMIPFVGTPFVLIPGALYLFLIGNVKESLILAFWAVLVVSTIDNLIRPLFISEGSKVHFLLVFLGVIGGISVWGFLGVFLGPIVLSLFVFFLDCYRRIWRAKREYSD
ncbi:MAG: AI-2E family transporter [Acetomicrobium sp.]|jgi:predicted PurR-regulated permease PerM|uniref:AI-2E family transporter n=1 Tax=Acetomicrobium sp. TaxID=1872099 RepID=UPI0016B32815|nr:AI-2E family transporter [Acetomicrobium sp.]MDI9376743.1 AI-2E family transporter [Synergistota bacterium]NLI42891.1 AI-2E family transporter [Synergistaceae bacterium]HQC88118.1 AI-2E family transporter [Acetomicrobium sp.]